MFMIFRESEEDGHAVLSYTARQYRLAGRNGLLHALWKKNGEPRNRGWTVTRDNMLAELSEDAALRDTRGLRLFVDAAPTAKRTIEVIEIVNIHGANGSRLNNQLTR